MTVSLGIQVGQRTDYRLDIGNEQDLVVAEFSHAFEAHLEPRPALSAFESALGEAPDSSVVGLAAAGALLGLAIGRSKESALVGAAIGGLLGLAGVGVANANGAPQLADAATRMLTRQ